MKLLEMPDIEAHAPGRGTTKIFVPGGWKARIATVTPDPETLRSYADYLGTEAEALEVHQRAYESGYLTGLRLAIARRAQEYARRFPDLVAPMPRRHRTSQEYVTLRGFDPAFLQGTYIPHDRTGRAGSDAIDYALTELAKRAREEAAA